MANKTSRETAQQTFRQFAWNLAGTLASPKGGSKAVVVTLYFLVVVGVPDCNGFAHPCGDTR